MAITAKRCSKGGGGRAYPCHN